MEKIVEVADPHRIDRTPDKTVVLMSGGKFFERGHIVKNICLNLYVLRRTESIGPYSLITVLVETDKGVIEMTYDEGYRGTNAIEEAVAFLTSHIGISGLILRSIIQLDQSLNRNNLMIIEPNEQDIEFYEV
jgi:hypothetical protein